jgi:hypothetical protein
MFKHKYTGADIFFITLAMSYVVMILSPGIGNSSDPIIIIEILVKSFILFWIVDRFI